MSNEEHKPLLDGEELKRVTWSVQEKAENGETYMTVMRGAANVRDWYENLIKEGKLIIHEPV